MVLVADPGCRLYWSGRELQWTAPWARSPAPGLSGRSAVFHLTRYFFTR